MPEWIRRIGFPTALETHSMTTLAAIQKQIAELQKKADAIAKSEAREAAAKAQALIAQYGLTAEDVGLGGAGKGARPGRRRQAAAAKPSGVARYRDPASGKTWTGVGRAPAWIADAKDRSKFLIDGGAAPAAPSKADKPAKAAKAGKPAKAASPAAALRKKAAKPAPVAEAAAPASEAG
jgi:DNA-binding protein H-NS